MIHAKFIAALGMALALGLAGQAWAQAPKFPAKPIRMVVGYAPGGGSDIMGRLIAQQITEALGQQVIVENRPGAAQNVAAELVAKSPADGYTLFMSSAALGINVSLYSKINYDPVNDFAPVAVFATSPNLLVVHPSFPARSVKEFVAVAKKNPGKLNFSSSGSGSTQHLSGELLKIKIGVDMTHIPYKGSAPSMTALASGEVDFSFNNIPAAQPLMIPGRIRALGITSAKRSPLLPELPTLIEGGLPGFITQTWYGVLAPAGTPGAVINTLNAVIVKAIRNDEFRARIAQTGADTITETPEYFRRMLKEEIERWAIVVKASKAKAE
ncbi:MAG: tripartite tricarboxylate transporter substrate binding protein [Betaproteobacteria bacterium]|nr:tripartite tricarboxylate transporter substrate binding protein [Betaproteobacteria bacterium]